jgi:hypothetical protein
MTKPKASRYLHMIIMPHLLQGCSVLNTRIKNGADELKDNEPYYLYYGYLNTQISTAFT